jgi:D-alanine--poly(phosphoribitol) ligase subunit 1
MTIDYACSLWGGPSDPPCLVTALAGAADRNCDTVAVVDGDISLTYGQLMRWAAHIAGELDRCGSLREGRVGVACPRGAGAVVALLAVALSGRTYVPLDLEYPRARLEHMLRDSETEVVLYDGEDPGLGDDLIRIPLVRPDDAAGSGPIGGGYDRSWITEHDPNLAVYVIYTSGSTGWPKGVVLPHSCLDNVVEWQAAASVAPDLRTAQFAPLNFDVSFQEIFGTLGAGGTLVVMPESFRRDSLGLLDWLVDNEIDRLFLPYVALQMLAVAGGFGGPVESLALKEINVAGEQLVRTDEIASFFSRAAGCRLVNHYGQSESAMVTYHVLPDSVDDWPTLPPIGIPLPGCELLIDAEEGSESVGELLVAGTPLSLGYLGRPELNARRYIEIEETAHGNTRAFRTGDLVRFEAGRVWLMTRIDDDVKLRGIRISLAEIEAQLLAMPEISAAVAVVTGGNGAPRVLRAAVTLKNGLHRLDEEAVRRKLAEVLPEVSVPLSVTVLDCLPKTPSGKADRDAVAATVETVGRASSVDLE